MHIIYTGAFRFPAQDAAAARVINNAKALSELGHTIEFISWGGNERIEDYVDDKYIYQGFEYINTLELIEPKQSFKNKLTALFQMGSKTMTILRKKKNVDMVIAYNASLWFVVKCKEYCKRNNIYFATDITEWYAPQEYIGGKLSPLCWMNELNMRFIQKKVKNKIVISSFLKNYYHSGNILLVPPLVNLNELKWDSTLKVIPEEIKRHKGVKIIYAGNPTCKDLLSNVISSIQSFKGEIQMIVVGVDKKQGSKYIEKRNSQDINDSVVFLGRVPQEMVPAYYKLADFSVIVREPTRKNMAGFPTKMAESYAAGCPVILNATSDLLDYVKNDENGIVLKDYTINGIVEGLQRAMKLLSRDFELIKNNARLTGKQKFDFSSYIDQFRCFIDNLN